MLICLIFPYYWCIVIKQTVIVPILCNCVMSAVYFLLLRLDEVQVYEQQLQFSEQTQSSRFESDIVSFLMASWPRFRHVFCNVKKQPLYFFDAQCSFATCVDRRAFGQYFPSFVINDLFICFLQTGMVFCDLFL